MMGIAGLVRDVPPRRLALGSDTDCLIGAALGGQLAELEASRGVTCATDADDAPGDDVLDETAPATQPLAGGFGRLP
jgi:hypothetical protein